MIYQERLLAEKIANQRIIAEADLEAVRDRQRKRNEKTTLNYIYSLFWFVVFGQTVPTKSVEAIKQQTKKFRDKNRYLAVYDKFEDSTMVQCVGFNLVGSMAGAMSIIAPDRMNAKPTMVFLGAGFIFSGDTLKDTPNDYFILFNYSGEEWKFLKSQRRGKFADGSRIGKRNT